MSETPTAVPFDPNATARNTVDFGDHFQGKSIIVTGGTKGVGRGIARAFLQAGASVLVCGRREPDALPSAEGRQAAFVSCDVRDPDSVDAMVQHAVDSLGGVDVLINNAGGAPFTDAATASPRFSEKIISLNLTSALHCAVAVNRHMQLHATGGAIVNIASVSGTRPSPGTAAYGAAKAGLLNLTQSLAVEWAPKVRMNAIVAGMIRTEQAHLHYGDEAGIAKVAATVPLGRLAVPQDIADACLFLSSPLASYVSGSAITVHGGGEKPAFLEAASANK